MSLTTLRHASYAALEPHAREHQGLSLVNKLLVVLIIVAAAFDKLVAEEVARGGPK